MFVRISTIQARPERLDEGLRYIRDEVQPRVDAMEGSFGLAAWVDRSSNRVAVTALWRDRASMEASAAAVGGLRQGAAEHLGGDASVEVFESAVVHRSSPPAPGQWTRSSRFDVAPSDIDLLVQHFETTSLPDITRHVGLVAAVLMVNREDGKALAAVTFDSRRSLDATAGASQARRDKATSDIPSLEVTGVSDMEMVTAGFRLPDDL